MEPKHHRQRGDCHHHHRQRGDRHGARRYPRPVFQRQLRHGHRCSWHRQLRRRTDRSSTQRGPPAATSAAVTQAPTVAQIEGGSIPTSVNVAGYNGSGQPTAAPNTLGCVDGYDHLPCIVFQQTNQSTSTTRKQLHHHLAIEAANATAGIYRVTGYVFATTAGNMQRTFKPHRRGLRQSDKQRRKRQRLGSRQRPGSFHHRNQQQRQCHRVPRASTSRPAPPHSAKKSH